MAKPSDIRLDVGFYRNLKTRKLLNALGPAGVIALQKLWIYAAEYHQSGVLDGLDDEDFDAICDWECGSQAERIRSALIRLGWVESDGVTLCDWATHQGWIVGAEARSRAASLAAQAKNRQRLVRGAGKRTAGRKRSARKRSAPLPSDPNPNGGGAPAPFAPLGAGQDAVHICSKCNRETLAVTEDDGMCMTCVAAAERETA